MTIDTNRLLHIADALENEERSYQAAFLRETADELDRLLEHQGPWEHIDSDACGHNWRCRFCNATVSRGRYPTAMGHKPSCEYNEFHCAVGRAEAAEAKLAMVRATLHEVGEFVHVDGGTYVPAHPIRQVLARVSELE